MSTSVGFYVACKVGDSLNVHYFLHVSLSEGYLVYIRPGMEVNRNLMEATE
jgi:hypothetical protein